MYSKGCISKSTYFTIYDVLFGAYRIFLHTFITKLLFCAIIELYLLSSFFLKLIQNEKAFSLLPRNRYN